MDSEFLDLMPDTVKLYRYAGVDGFNQGIHDTFYTSIRCRIVYKKKQFHQSDGQLVLSKAIIYFYGNNTIVPEDKLVLPDNSSPLIVDIQRYPDENGAYYEQVYVI